MVPLVLHAKLPARIKRKGKWFYSFCPTLDIHSQGETEEMAEKNLVEAITLFFVSCIERGTLEAALKESGYVPVLDSAALYEQNATKHTRLIDIAVPFSKRKTGDNVECPG